MVYTHNMKTKRLKIAIVCAIVAVFSVMSISDLVYASGQNTCACCANACHGAIKGCACSHQVLQLFLPERGTSGELCLSGYLTSVSSTSYSSRSVHDIFHPPNA
jgi:hypothetical protein